MWLNFPVLTIVSSGKCTALLGHTWSLHDRGYHRNRNWKRLCIKSTHRSLKLSWVKLELLAPKMWQRAGFIWRSIGISPFPLGGMESCWHPTDGYRLRFKCVYALSVSLLLPQKAFNQSADSFTSLSFSRQCSGTFRTLGTTPGSQPSHRLLWHTPGWK